MLAGKVQAFGLSESIGIVDTDGDAAAIRRNAPHAEPVFAFNP